MDEDLTATTSADSALFGDVAGLIDGARQRAAVSVNSELVMLYWSVGKRVREEVLGGERAAYGEQVVKRLATRLIERYGRGWSKPNLLKMLQFASDFPVQSIVSTLSRQSSRSQTADLLGCVRLGHPQCVRTMGGRRDVSCVQWVHTRGRGAVL